MGECSATQLAEVLPVDPSRISRLVNGMVNMGLLRRRRTPTDRRIVMLRLTEKGNELTLHISERVNAYYAKLTEGIGEDEMREFVSTATKVLANYATMAPPP